MKSVMLTIRLKWFYLTYKGIKTIEVRKSCPKDFVGDVYEVVSKTNFEKDLMEIPETERKFFKQFKGKVGLKFTLDKVEEIKLNLAMRFFTKSMFETEIAKKSCLSSAELFNYLYNNSGYAWHISNLEIFDRPIELSEFYKVSCKGCLFENTQTCHNDINGKYCRITKAPQSMCYIESEK